MNKVILGENFHPFFNLALENTLLENAEDDLCLFLWQNNHTIVIGATQNTFLECDCKSFLASGGTLARRTTGGGCVYHDLGNLNFSFVAKSQYNLQLQQEIILNAVKSFGILAEISGRNDILANGKKFSGNAFKSSRGAHLHHGTLLVNSNMEILSKYLTVDTQKLQSKGIKSVKSRVINLCELCPDINIDKLKIAMINSFCNIFPKTEIISEKTYLENHREQISNWQSKLSSHEYIFDNPRFEIQFSHQFSFGKAEFCFDVKDNRIANCKIYSDAIDADYFLSLQNQFLSKKFAKDELCMLFSSNIHTYDLEIKNFFENIVL